MIKRLTASTVIMMALIMGVLIVSGEQSAMAQERYYRSHEHYDRGRTYDRSYDRGYYDRYRGRYYEDKEATTGNLIKRTGIGAGIGVLGGALIGGKTGAIIGGAAGATGGYIYHRVKVDEQQDRIYGRHHY
ncbi:MAG: hypothetical protein J2P31_02775 [Blastocatellia bacterium]|nr:hypothetical protein [Blastocatellia bacterium]